MLSQSSHLLDAILWKERLLTGPSQSDCGHDRQLSRYTNMMRHCTALWCLYSSLLVAMDLIQIVYCDNLQRTAYSRSSLRNRNHRGHHRLTFKSNICRRASRGLFGSGHCNSRPWWGSACQCVRLIGSLLEERLARPRASQQG